MNWTHERIEELMRLRAEGLTTYELARHFNLTRNAICGKLHREKIKRGIIEATPRDYSNRPKQRREKMLTLPIRAESVSAFVTPAVAAPDLGQIASIVDVTGCRWPVHDDPSFVGGVAFCNHEQKPGTSYCPYHAALNKAAYSDELIRRTFSQVNYILKRIAA